MRIAIRHRTRYTYDRSIDYTAQLIRLTPRHHSGQRVLGWRVIEEPDRLLPQTDDGYGNVVNMLTLNRQHTAATILAEGEVETSDTNGVVLQAIERLPPLFYLRSSDFTQPDAAIAALAAEAGAAADPIERLHRLMVLIRERVDYVIGATSSATTAAQALAQGSGVCQDHAQVFAAAARCLGQPARYVSGYLWTPAGTSEASHAWAEAHVDGLGWIGFDPANRICPTEAYVRVAIGLDHLEAAPVRGVRRGVAEEALDVTVDVRDAHDQQQ